MTTESRCSLSTQNGKLLNSHPKQQLLLLLLLLHPLSPSLALSLSQSVSLCVCVCLCLCLCLSLCLSGWASFQPKRVALFPPAAAVRTTDLLLHKVPTIKDSHFGEEKQTPFPNPKRVKEKKLQYYNNKEESSITPKVAAAAAAIDFPMAQKAAKVGAREREREQTKQTNKRRKKKMDAQGADGHILGVLLGPLGDGPLDPS